MASNRHLSRILAVQSLYEWEFISTRFPSEQKYDQKKKMTEILDRNYKEFEKAVSNREFIDELVWGVLENTERIDLLLLRLPLNGQYLRLLW